MTDPPPPTASKKDKAKRLRRKAAEAAEKARKLVDAAARRERVKATKTWEDPAAASPSGEPPPPEPAVPDSGHGRDPVHEPEHEPTPDVHETAPASGYDTPTPESHMPPVDDPESPAPTDHDHAPPAPPPEGQLPELHPKEIPQAMSVIMYDIADQGPREQRYAEMRQLVGEAYRIIAKAGMWGTHKSREARLKMKDVKKVTPVAPIEDKAKVEAVYVQVKAKLERVNEIHDKNLGHDNLIRRLLAFMERHKAPIQQLIEANKEKKELEKLLKQTTYTIPEFVKAINLFFTHVGPDPSHVFAGKKVKLDNLFALTIQGCAGSHVLFQEYHERVAVSEEGLNHLNRFFHELAQKKTFSPKEIITYHNLVADRLLSENLTTKHIEYEGKRLSIEIYNKGFIQLHGLDAAIRVDGTFEQTLKESILRIFQNLTLLPTNDEIIQLNKKVYRIRPFTIISLGQLINILQHTFHEGGTAAEEYLEKFIPFGFTKGEIDHIMQLERFLYTHPEEPRAMEIRSLISVIPI
ncbi:hypothetical protein HZB02_00450 [Candidatus Woesearchaeota archaeon]|nr:hypothetical protein [Candidatus Woesearchaeota archaeon]